MEQENPNQPHPVETPNEPRPAATDGGSPDQRRRRPRRRYPRRRFYDRGPGGDNSGPQENSNYEQNGPGGDGAMEGEGSEIENAEQSQAEPEFGEGIIEISGKGFGF